ncbi:MAG: polysaccharide biosynthesis C-terminal domain-containing protein, partial [Rhodothermia bacterium]
VFGWLWQQDLLGETGRAISYDLLLPILIALPFQGVALYMNRIMVGASWFPALNLYILLNNLAPPVFLLGFVIIGGQGVTGAIAAILSTGVLTAMVSSIMVFVKYRPRLRIELKFLAKAAHYGFKAWIGALANRTSIRLDQFVVGFVQAPEVLGVYRIAVMIAELLWLAPDAVTIPLFNRISKTEKLTDRLRVTMQSHRVLIVVVSALGAGLLVTSWWAVPWILGPDYIDARWLLAILLPGATMLVTARFLGMFFTASGMPEKASAVEVVGAAASFAGYLTLIPLLGVAGAAIATSASYSVIAVTAYFMFVRTAKSHPVRLYRATAEDLHWATALVRDSFSIWRNRFRRAN